MIFLTTSIINKSISGFLLFVLISSVNLGVILFLLCAITYATIDGIKISINNRKYDLIWNNTPELFYKGEVYNFFSKEEKTLYYVPKNNPVKEKKIIIYSKIINDISSYNEEKQLTPYRGELI